MAEPSAFAPDGESGFIAVPARRERGVLRTGVASATDAVVRVLIPEHRRPSGIAWRAPDDEEAREEQRAELYADLHGDLRESLHGELRAELDADLDELRADLYDEIDELHDLVVPSAGVVAHAPLEEATRVRTRARRVVFVGATVLSLTLVGAVTMLWQRADTVPARPPAPVTIAPPQLDDVMAHVDRLDQQLAGLLAVSANPAAPSDVSTQIGALRTDLSGVRGCLQAFKRALAAGERLVYAISYC
jgi:hypothetical protein